MYKKAVLPNLEKKQNAYQKVKDTKQAETEHYRWVSELKLNSESGMLPPRLLKLKSLKKKRLQLHGYKMHKTRAGTFYPISASPTINGITYRCCKLRYSPILDGIESEMLLFLNSLQYTQPRFQVNARRKRKSKKDKCVWGITRCHIRICKSAALQDTQRLHIPYKC